MLVQFLYSWWTLLVRSWRFFPGRWWSLGVWEVFCAGNILTPKKTWSELRLRGDVYLTDDIWDISIYISVGFLPPKMAASISKEKNGGFFVPRRFIASFTLHFGEEVRGSFLKMTIFVCEIFLEVIRQFQGIMEVTSNNKSGQLLLRAFVLFWVTFNWDLPFNEDCSDKQRC